MTSIHATPNADQVNAENQLLDFLFDPNEKEMRLIGPGGTGKSWLVKRFIEKTLKEYKENCKLIGLEPDYTNYVLTALTNKAAQSLQDETGLDVQTLHSWLSLTVKPNYNTGKQDLKRTASWQIHNKYLIFVDEAYMTDSKLLKELRDATMNCKIVFIGDDKQLDPVDASHSPITELKVRTAELTIPVRNAGSKDLQNLCTLFRQNVANVVESTEKGIPYKWPYIPLVPGVIDHIDEVELEALLRGPFATPSNDHLIMAFSNARVNFYNQFLREVRGQDHLFQVGEVLISNDTYEQGRFRIRNEQTVEIAKADNHISWLKLGHLDVPTQFVEIKHAPDQKIPVIIDRAFHKEAMKYAANQAKTGQSDWKPYYDLKENFADFRPRDASTFHKAQGSSKDVVVIDLNNLGTCNFPVMTARMLYVGLSRARKRVILFGNLPSKYGGVIF